MIVILSTLRNMPFKKCTESIADCKYLVMNIMNTIAHFQNISKHELLRIIFTDVIKKKGSLGGSLWSSILYIIRKRRVPAIRKDSCETS
jgi:hypothetical protein